MKRTFLDQLIGFFSPETERKRINSRAKTELFLRSYDAASTFNTDDWTSATKGSAISEISSALDSLRSKGSDAVRNNTYGARAVMAIANNVVGAGILPHIKGKSRLQEKKIAQAWKEWAETTLCDSDRRNNFYALQSLAMRSLVERGEVLLMKEISKEGIKVKLLESDFINSTLKTGSYRDGVKLDSSGRVVSYALYKTHPGDPFPSLEFRDVPVELVSHVYRQDRPGQLRGVSWFAPVLRQLEDLAQYQQATLIGRKIAACFSAFITSNDGDGTLSNSDLKTKREIDSTLSPGTIKYLNQGEGVVLSSPPKVDGYQEYVNQVLRSVASGMGISYESLTSDYSQVNYSSGRMAHLEFRKNIENWRWSLFIPQFCEPAFQHFLEWCLIYKGIPIEGVTCDWIPPSWTMLDPNKEIAAMKDALRSGLMSYPKAIRELGYEPEDMMQEIADSNERFDELEIILDSDPRKTTSAGQLQMNTATQNGDNSVQEDNATSNSDGGN